MWISFLVILLITHTSNFVIAKLKRQPWDHLLNWSVIRVLIDDWDKVARQTRPNHPQFSIVKGSIWSRANPGCKCCDDPRYGLRQNMFAR